MTFIVIEPPPPIVSLEEAKLHCRVDESDTASDTLIEAYISAATAWIDGPAGWLGRALGVQLLEWQGSGWPCDYYKLPFQPLIEIVSISYVDPDGASHSFPVPDPWSFEGAPAVRGRPGDVKIQYRAGYAKAGAEEGEWISTLPKPIYVAILMLVMHWYENRSAVEIGSSPSSLPMGVEALLSTYRVWSV